MTKHLIRSVELGAVEKMAEILSAYYLVPVKFLTTVNRRHSESAVIARAIMMKVLKEKGYSLEKIGELCGNKTHSSVIHDLNILEDYRKFNRDRKVEIDEFYEICKNEYIEMKQKGIQIINKIIRESYLFMKEPEYFL